jgi:hypothetical protein
MKIYKINKEIRNDFFFQSVYGLFYPAVLGTFLVDIIKNALSGELFNNGFFPVISLIILVWYFVLDFYIGFANFKGKENEYDIRYLLCDMAVISAAFIAYYGLWLSKPKLEFLLFGSLAIICLILVLLDYFDAIDSKTKYKITNLYTMILIMLGLLSIGLSIVSLTLSFSMFYLIIKNIFILVIGLGILYYTFYILSEESYEVE